MNLDTDLITMVLTDVTYRPGARVNLQAFLSAGGNPDRCFDMHDHTIRLLSTAAANGWDDAVADLLSAGTDVHADNDWALCLAAENGHLSVVECLLAAGADIHAERDLALRLAASNGHLSVVERLLAAGADIHAERDLALRLAASNGHLSVVERLLAAGADVHARDEEALWLAARNGHRSVAACLLSAGARADRSITEHSVDDRYTVCTTLDTVAAAIPAEQRQQLLAMAPASFPALRALCAAQTRRRAAEHRQGKTP